MFNSEILNFKKIYMFLILFIFNLLIFFFLGGKSSLFSDVSRELYIPYAMNSGDVLYKDIFNVYAPLGYQILSFITSVFGDNFRVFFLVGFINSTFILWGLYLILRLFIKNNTISFFALSTIVLTCFYTISQTNYILPYSYSLVFALNALIWALVFLLYFYKKDNIIFLYLSFLFYGVSISCKYEFLPFIIVLIYTLFYKKIALKSVFVSLFYSFFMPFLSLIALFVDGVSFVDLKNAIDYILSLSAAESVNVLYSYLGFIPSKKSLFDLSINFVKVFSFVGIVLLIQLFSAKKKLLFSILTSIIFVFSLFFLHKTMVDSNAFYFNWVGIISLIIFIIYFKKIYENKLFFILYFSTLVCSLKCVFNISFNSYGTYYFPLLFISLVGFLRIFVADNSNIDKKVIDKIFIFFLCLTSCLYYFSNFDRSRLVYNSVMEINENSIITESLHVEPILKTVNWLKENSNTNDVVLVMPEGSVINYLARRKSHNKFYYLIPPNIDVFGEENIVQNLKNDLPDFIVLQPMSYTNFNETFFCESFGTKICEIIPKYYEYPKVFGSDFWLAIYKKRNINEK